MSREIWVDVKVSNPSVPSRSVGVRAFVDNGSTDSALPAVLLRKIGLRARGVERYEIWGGKTVRRKYAYAEFTIGRRSGPAKVTLEPAHEVPTVGTTTLEALGYDIDMKNGGLRSYIPRGPTLRRRPHRPLP
ncbi:MAG: hypothetical protein HYY93_14235 [Planctomycetes bacterium]|nr:hypothetical protein [Planctomycetota bacterium]